MSDYYEITSGINPDLLGPSVEHDQLLDKNVQLKPMLFAGYSPSSIGGWENFLGFFHSIQACKAALLEKYPKAYNMWAHIVMNWEIIVYADVDDETGEWYFSEIQCCPDCKNDAVACVCMENNED